MMTGLGWSGKTSGVSVQDEWSATNKPKPESKVAPIAVAPRKPWSVWGLHENEEAYHAVVSRRRFGAYRWSYKPGAGVFGAGRF
jgi:hypothetical protein